MTAPANAERVRRIRAASEAVGRCVAIMADLPGPKIRIGRIEPEPVQLHAGENFILTVEEMVGSRERVSVSFKDLRGVVKRGDRLFLNDGLVQLTVERVAGREVHCQYQSVANCGGNTFRHSPSALEVTESE